MVPIGRGRNSDGYLIMVDRFLYLALESIYFAEDTMRLADPILFAFLWEESDRAECGFFCGVQLFARPE